MTFQESLNAKNQKEALVAGSRQAELAPYQMVGLHWLQATTGLCRGRPSPTDSIFSCSDSAVLNHELHTPGRLVVLCLDTTGV
ncbi:hypothetical protein NDU88_002269 [Pleurodeles waltl]|uniref:Uncharacterized protein n=1 Tax=Pleurodeles waltl TaxID=8319 RepID=A0AAV7M3L3_PLEWA|nr:hypothetical protein NDU88_002269 [Pleurodeles waltl]